MKFIISPRVGPPTISTLRFVVLVFIVLCGPLGPGSFQGAQGYLVMRQPASEISVRYDEYDRGDDILGELIPNSDDVDGDMDGERYTHTMTESERKENILQTNPDAQLSTTELLRKYGYPAESHEVVTQDGYILTMHRIPHGRNESKESVNRTRPVIFLHHGLLCSSADWIMNTVDKALAYQLADKGYDVWLANARGNTYSRRHMSLSPEVAEFWDFSFHEVGVYDLPAEIDYILANTSADRIHYIGHSMGTVVFWILMSEHPQYNSKIHSMFALGPVAFLNGTVSPIRHFMEIATELQVAELIFGEKEFLPSHGLLNELEGYICDEKVLERAICENIIFLLCGFDRPQLNESMIPVIMGHDPAGTSSHTVIHFLQLMKSAKFRQFDFGKTRNRRRYGVEQPPEYDLSKVRAKVALFYGQNDWLAVPGDVLELASKLPNLALTYKVKLESFNHLDFLFAVDSNKLLYNDIFRLLRKI